MRGRIPAGKVSVAESVARELEREITGGQLQPDTRLGTKEDLRRQFGVAAGTINEVIKLLANRGLLRSRPGPGGGIFVTIASGRAHLSHPIDWDGWELATLDEYLLTREALWPLVCRGAARHHQDKDIRALEQDLEAMEANLGRPKAYERHSAALHRRMAAACRNPLLESLYLTYLDLVEEVVARDDLYDTADRPTHLSVHRRLVEAIDAGVGDALEAALAGYQAYFRNPPRTQGSRKGIGVPV